MIVSRLKPKTANAQLFLELARRAFRRQMSYRAATIAGLTTNIFFGLLRALIMVALYAQRTEVAGITLRDAITYTALTQAIIGYLSLFSWYDLMRSVYTGAIASDLLKPVDTFVYWLAQDIGRATAAFFTRGLTIVLAYALFTDLSYPQTLTNWLHLAIALILALLVSFSWRFITNLPAFWIPNALGIGRFFFMISMFLSGFLMPLRFFPDWVVKLAYLTPFPYTVNTVIEVYLGLLTGPQLYLTFLYQILWALGLFLLGQLILRAGVRRLVVQGG